MNFLFIYINCLYWPDLTYLGGTAEIKDAPILHAQSAQRVSCLNALTQTSYIKVNQTHWCCGLVRVNVPWTAIHGITEYQVLSTDPFFGQNSLDKMGQPPEKLDLKNFQCCRIPHFPGEMIPVDDCSIVRKIPFVSNWNLPVKNSSPLSSFPCDSLRKESPHPCSHLKSWNKKIFLRFLPVRVWAVHHSGTGWNVSLGVWVSCRFRRVPAVPAVLGSEPCSCALSGLLIPDCQQGIVSNDSWREACRNSPPPEVIPTVLSWLWSSLCAGHSPHEEVWVWGMDGHREDVCWCLHKQFQGWGGGC